MTVPIAPSFANHCSGEGNVFDGGGEVVAECHVEDPGQPGSRTVDELWNRYCTDAGAYQEGDEVGFYEIGLVDPNEIDLFGLDLAGEYVWYDVICWRDGREATERQIIVETTPAVSPEVMRDDVAA
ncbi:MAG: hypothetical protein ACRDQW_17035, partial [Haloechinothrix sp.]